MDSFFTSVELREKPELKGLPLVSGTNPGGRKGRGVVSTCSYGARKSGFIQQAGITGLQVMPRCCFLPVNIRLYETVSTNVRKYLRNLIDDPSDQCSPT